MCNATQPAVAQKYLTLYDSADEAIQFSKESNLQQADSSEFSVSPRAGMVNMFPSRCSTKVNKSPPSRPYFVHCHQQEMLGEGVGLPGSPKGIPETFLRREVMAHKCQGNDGCLSGFESLLSESQQYFILTRWGTHFKILSEMGLLIWDWCIERIISITGTFV